MPLRRLLAVILATALVSTTASPAYAEDDFMDDHFNSPLGPDDGKVSTAKKVVVITFLTGALVGWGASFVYLFKANGAESDRKDLLESTGGGSDSMNAQCTSVDQCAQLESLKQKRDDAKSSWENSMIVGSAFGAATVAAILLWPNAAREKVRIAPQTGQNGNGVVLQGSF